jgi:multidrug efflux system membrane fusion protein
VIAMLVCCILYGYRLKSAPAVAAAAPRSNAPVPVQIALAHRADVPVYVQGLGTAQGSETVKVTARVDGQLQKLGFEEGQTVHKGDVLALIDPRPYQAAYEQAVAARNKDAVQLANAKRDLERYQSLVAQGLISTQETDTQQAQVAQLEAQLQEDQAGIDSARTQLGYTTVIAPIDGRTGIRLVDPGNIVHAADTTGIVILTRLHPMSVIFTLPEEQVMAVNAALARGPLAVTVLPRDGDTELDRGTVALMDNQIDTTTGTVRLKASFPNEHDVLWPGEFVSVRALLETRHDAVVVPAAAVQHGPDGPFAYVVRANSTVAAQPLTLGPETGTSVVVTKGLDEGARVVTSNQYRLQPDAPVQIASGSSAVAGTN